MMVILAIVVLAVVVFQPKKSKKIEDIRNEVTTVSTKEEVKKTSPVEKVFLTKEQEEAIDSNENQQQILEVVHTFMGVFDNVTTKDYQEMMPQVYDIMTKEAKETILPFYDGDKNMDEITTKLLEEHSYISYETNSNQAKVISLVTKGQSYNSDPTQYTTNYILVHELVREDGEWKIDSRISQSTPATFSSQLFE